MRTATDFHFPVSVEELQIYWSRFNRSYFQNRLPPIEIQWSKRLRSSSGLFVSKTGPRSQWVSSEERHGKGRVIRLSFPLLHDQSINEIQGTLAHEMIHQWQFDVKKNRPSHGREFRRLMTIMNQDGLDITVYHSLNKKVEIAEQSSWKCIQCGQSYHRQRNTLSLRQDHCRYCNGFLEEESITKPIQLSFNFILLDY